MAQSGIRSVWHVVQGFGTPSRLVVTGEMNLNVWLRTLTLPMVRSIAGMWQATQRLPVLLALCWVCCSIVPRGPGWT